MPQTQSETLAARLPLPTPKTGQVPQVIIPSALELTLDQETRLLRHCAQRFKDLSTELGRADYEQPAHNTGAVNVLLKNHSTHFGRRHLSHLIYQQRMEWRRDMLGGLYAETNIHLPITTRIVSQQIARANKTFFGTSPFFATHGLSADSDLLAQDVDAYANHQLDTLGGISASLSSAVELAFIQGETAVKTRHHKLSSYFQSWSEVAIDAQGNPIIAQDGDYIYKTDLFVESTLPVVDPATGQPATDPTTGQPLTQPGGLVLKRDMSTPQPAQITFQTVKTDQLRVLEDKVESRPIYYLDFLCPLNATDVQAADIAIHCYNAKLIELADRYLQEQWGESATDQLDRVSRLVNELRGGHSDTKQALADRGRPEQSEATTGVTGADREEPIVGLAECWLWYDVLGDGVLRNIMVLMDQDGKVPVFYDYAGNLTDDGLRPFDIVRINPIPGRWHGQGNVERFWQLQDQADLLINRAMFAESRAARVDFFDPSLTVEGASNPNLEVNWGGSHTLTPGSKASDALTSVYLTNIKGAALKDLLQTVLQTMQSMSAVSNVNDGAMAGLDTAKLATGIKNLEASGEELFHQYISHLRPCLEAILRRALRTLLRQTLQSGGTGQKKLTEFFDRPSKRIVSIDPRRLQGLDLDLSLTLSTYDRQSRLQSSQLAYTMLDAYLTSIGAPVEIREQRLGPLVADTLRALQVRDADEKVAPIPAQLRLPPAAPTGAPGPVTAGTPPAEDIPI